jgi:hypothetical protein
MILITGTIESGCWADSDVFHIEGEFNEKCPASRAFLISTDLWPVH